jgi:hypothetical protein
VWVCMWFCVGGIGVVVGCVWVCERLYVDLWVLMCVWVCCACVSVCGCVCLCLLVFGCVCECMCLYVCRLVGGVDGG